jgi:hypothetical protein
MSLLTKDGRGSVLVDRLMNHDASTKRRLELELQKCDSRVQDKLNGMRNTSIKDAYSKFKKIRRCRTVVRLPFFRLPVYLSVYLPVGLSICLSL